MPNLPKLTKMKFGVIDAMYMNTLVDAAQSFNSLRPALSGLITKSNKQLPTPFLAQITEATPYTEIEITRANGTTETVAVMWKYEWKTVGIDTVDGSEMVIGDIESTITTEDISKSIDIDPQGGGWTEEIVSGLAFNLAEVSNANSYEDNGVIFGVNVSGDSYPAGFIPYGTEVGAYLMLQKIFTREATAIYFFDRQGTHDGTCE
tara:strand:+ start:14531 stop:15145 length:615 start_codon:yes stop_codon:yes gene_type:complete